MWFSSVCQCDGYNYLHNPQLTCLNSDTGSIITVVHHDDQMSAKTLIDLVVANISSHDPPVVNLPHHGWIMFLTFPSVDLDSNSDTDGTLNLEIIIAAAGALSSIAVLGLCCLSTALICYLRKR